MYKVIHTIITNGFLSNRFFTIFAILSAICAAGFISPVLFRLTWILLFIFSIVLVADVLLILMSGGKLDLERDIPGILPLGDATDVVIRVKSRFPYALKTSIIDEWPVEFQERDFKISLDLPAYGLKQVKYPIRPLQRGNFKFGKTNLFVQSVLGLFSTPEAI